CDYCVSKGGAVGFACRFLERSIPLQRLNSRVPSRGGCSATPGLEDFDKHREQRYEDHPKNHLLEVPAHDGHLTELVPDGHHECDPERPAQQAEEKKARVWHLRHTRNKRRARADDGDESRIHDSPRAILLIKL